MYHFKQAVPVLASLDIGLTMEFYKQKLGFVSRYQDESYAVARREDMEIHFWKCEDKIFPENTSCYIYVSDVDALYEEMQNNGVVHPNSTIEDQPWGMREFAILDLDGNLIRFGQSLD